MTSLNLFQRGRRGRGRNRRYYIPAVVSLLILTSGVAAQPPCRTAFEEPEFALAAGCLVKSGGRMLVVRHYFGGRLGLPAGHANQGESAQCTAHRETWEETGLDVIVHGMLKRFRNGFALYRCELPDTGAALRDAPAVPESGKSEITQVLWLDPASTKPSDWRFERQYPVIIQIFNE